MQLWNQANCPYVQQPTSQHRVVRLCVGIFFPFGIVPNVGDKSHPLHKRQLCNGAA